MVWFIIRIKILLEKQSALQLIRKCCIVIIYIPTNEHIALLLEIH
jgi:hypothetical protein